MTRRLEDSLTCILCLLHVYCIFKAIMIFDLGNYSRRLFFAGILCLSGIHCYLTQIRLFLLAMSRICLSKTFKMEKMPLNCLKSHAYKPMLLCALLLLSDSEVGIPNFRKFFSPCFGSENRSSMNYPLRNFKY